MKKIKIGLVGCGAIGSSLAKEIAFKMKESAVLSGLYDIRPQMSQALSRQLTKSEKLRVNSLEALIARADLVIEASSARAAWEITRKSLAAGRMVMAMSVGGLAGHLKELSLLAKRSGARLYLPSGAVTGIDALKAANIAGVKSIILTTRKHPDAFKGVAYVEKKFKLAGLKKDKVLFNGSALQAVKYFPQNINVAAVLGLAGIGLAKTRVRIIASPFTRNNIHEILIESKAAKIFTRTENIVHPRNPKTSYLAVLSAIAALKQIFQPVKIGT